jgi:hypothetical protein
MRWLQKMTMESNQPGFLKESGLMPGHQLFDKEPIDLEQLSVYCEKLETRYARYSKRMYLKGRREAFIRVFDTKSHPGSHTKQLHRLQGISALDTVKAEIQKTRSELELAKTFAERDKNDEQWLQTLEQYEKDLAFAEADLDKIPLITLYEKSRKLEQKLKRYEAKYNTLLKGRYSNIIPTRYLYDHPAGYWSICAFIYGAEIVVNYSAVVNLGEISNSMALLLAFAISGLMSITAMVSGSNLKKGKRWSGILWGLAGVLLCLGVMVLRLDKNVVLTFAVFVFFGISLLLSYAKAINFDLFQAERKISKLKVKLARALTQNAKIETADHLQRTEIRTQYQGSTGTLSMIWNRTLQQQIDEYNKQIQQLDILEKQYEKRLNSLFEEGCQNYNRGYILMSRALFRKVRPNIPGETVPSLSTVNKEENKSGNGQAGLQIAKTVILCIVGSLLFSCTPAEVHEVTILIDQTHEHQIEASRLSDYVFDQVLQIDESGMRDEIRLTVSAIGETSKQPAKLLKLPEGDPWVSRKDVERRKQIHDFTSSADSLIHEVMSTKDSLVFSFIHENIALHLNRLAALPGDANRHVIVLSDMLIHTPDLSVYRSPQLLDDVQELETRLIEFSPLPACDNIEIYIAYFPDRYTDALFSKSLNFFTGLYNKHGARTTYLQRIQ